MRAGKHLAGWSIAALGLMFGTMTPAQASPIQTPVTFNTIGSVDTFGVTGTPVVTFQGVSHGTMTTGSSFSLGQFQIAAPPAGTSSTYLNIPFQILFKAESVGGAAPSPNETPVILSGWLNGRVSSADGSTLSESNLKVFFNAPVYTPESYPPYPTTVLPFQTGGFTNYLSVTSPGDNGQPIQALMITAQTVPEPGALALFACIAGLTAWKARRRGRAVQGV
jgi:hypothetical protein